MLEFLETILFVLKLFNMIKSLWVEAGLIKDRPGLVLRTDGSAVRLDELRLLPCPTGHPSLRGFEVGLKGV